MRSKVVDEARARDGARLRWSGGLGVALKARAAAREQRAQPAASVRARQRGELVGKGAAGNVVRNKIMEAAAKKMGIEQLGLAGQIPAIGGLIQAYAPPVLGLTGLAAIKNKIASRGLQDAMRRESTRDLQQRIDKGDFGSNVPTSQDAARVSSGGGGSGNYGMPGRAATSYEDL